MRKRREYSQSGFYHVIVRGVNKQNIFYDNRDRKLFLGIIRKYCKKLGVRIHAYCLMDNHVHLELEDPFHRISLFMQSVCSLYARLFNRKYDRIGHLFQERYASEVINDNSYFLTVFRYVLQNPVKSKLSEMKNYSWSSYNSYKNDESFVHKKLLFDLFGSLNNLYRFLDVENRELCLEVEVRPSERENDYINRIKFVLNTENPIINPELPEQQILEKIRKLRDSGLSVRTIVRATGINRHVALRA